MSTTAGAPTAAQRKPPIRMKTALWTAMWLAIVFVFITSELLLIADYPLYRAYRLQVIADRYRLVPHALFGTLALLIGPLQFSTRLRQKHLKLHRVLGRVYVVSVFLAAAMAFAIAWGRPLMPAISVQAGAWIVCTAMAFVTAWNRQIAQHRQWMMRSYAVTFTFIVLRLLNLWPAYWNLTDATFVIVDISTTFASILTVDIGLSWRELVTSRR
jgi:uncharacterized membrane protein